MCRAARAHEHAVKEAHQIKACGQEDLLLVFPLSDVQQGVEGAPLGGEPIHAVPQRSLGAVEELEEVAALSGAQKLRVLGNKALDVESDVVQLWPDIFLKDFHRFLKFNKGQNYCSFKTTILQVL